jgi:hypothetical protein
MGLVLAASRQNAKPHSQGGRQHCFRTHRKLGNPLAADIPDIACIHWMPGLVISAFFWFSQFFNP